MLRRDNFLVDGFALSIVGKMDMDGAHRRAEESSFFSGVWYLDTLKRDLRW